MQLVDFCGNVLQHPAFRVLLKHSSNVTVVLFCFYLKTYFPNFDTVSSLFSIKQHIQQLWNAPMGRLAHWSVPFTITNNPISFPSFLVFTNPSIKMHCSNMSTGSEQKQIKLTVKSFKLTHNRSLVTFHL